MLYDQKDIDSLCLCAWREARGDGNDAMRAVMHVICNRTKATGFPKTVHEVIYQRNAFTSMSVPSDPEFRLLPAPDDAQYAYCQSVAPDVLEGTDDDLTHGAVYYANEEHITSGWYKRVIMDSGRHPVVAKIGKQTFRTSEINW